MEGGGRAKARERESVVGGGRGDLGRWEEYCCARTWCCGREREHLRKSHMSSHNGTLTVSSSLARYLLLPPLPPQPHVLLLLLLLSSTSSSVPSTTTSSSVPSTTKATRTPLPPSTITNYSHT
ncbi:hypothetical protein Pcinc_014428 [Petrolisthes cinctipes]|uniref:Uncharacterized protein n=1 Tax=Petrolisthes cinctipes TaxID=88211 RepID=A0AAE1FWM2_PETCI|nr:hypothetical protein Pcinc_014428 [Petrolisthes cinctipes]